MKIKISIQHIISLVILLISFDIPYIYQVAPASLNILFYLRITAIISLVFWSIVAQKKMVSGFYCLFILLICWILFVTYKNGFTVNSFLKLVASPLLLCTYIETNRNSKSILYILESAKLILFILISIDILSMLVYPSGLYSTQAYSTNWFLGYKTQRFPFYLFYIVSSSILNYFKKDRISLFSITFYAFMIFGMLRSEATMSVVMLLFVIMMSWFATIAKNRKYVNRIFSFFSNSMILVTVYALLSYLVLILNTSSFVQSIIVNIFHKSATLSTRTVLWKRILYLYKDQFLQGVGYIDVENFTKKFESIFYTNAHNLSLTILLTGGIVLVILYIIIHSWAIKDIALQRDKTYANIYIVAIVSMLLVGLTSSALFFCFCDFIFYFLLRTDISKLDRGTNEKSIF